jgi:ANTAR domain-containing protein
VPELVPDMSAAVVACAFSRRLLGREDPTQILQLLRETLSEWCGTEHVAVDLEGSDLRSVGSALAGELHEGLEAPDEGMLLRHSVATTWPGRLRLSVYTPAADAFDDTARATTEMLAELTLPALDTARKIRLFHEALARRDTIGRAKGMLTERFGMDDARAFALLRRISQERHLRLRDVADALVSGTLDLSVRSAAATPALATPSLTG